MSFGGCTVPLVYLVTVITLGNNFPAGYIITSINVVQFIILKWIRQVRCSEEFHHNNTLYIWNHSDYHKLWCQSVPPQEEASMLAYNAELGTLWALIGCAVSTGGFVGVWPSIWLRHRVGNKNTLYIANIIAVSGTLLCSLCKLAESVWMLVIGRFLLGVFHGLSGAVVPPYIVEVSPVIWRGVMLNFPVLTFNLGLLTSVVLGLPSILGTESLWTFIIWIRLLCVVFVFAALPFCPESPVYLVRKKRHKEARKSLKWLRRTDNIEDELKEIQQRCDQSAMKARVTVSELFQFTLFRRTLLICVVAMMAGQFSGFMAIVVYSTAILASAGLGKAITVYGTISILTLQNLGTILAMFLTERAGRRPLMLIGSAGCILANLAMVVCIQLSNVSPWLAYGSVACLLFFILIFSLGPGSLPWVLTPEMFPDRARGVAVVVVMAFGCLGALVTAFVFPIAQVLIGEWIFAAFAGLLALCLVYLYFALIETKGKSYDVIETELCKKFGITTKEERGTC